MLIARAWLELVFIDLMWFRGFKALRSLVPPRTAPIPPDSEKALEEVVKAVDAARVLYVKPVMCLQHSIVVIRLLRRRGVDAHLVIAAQLMPIRAHAWVEVAGNVVTDKVEAQESFCILDRW